jgi:hypothetical protein
MDFEKFITNADKLLSLFFRYELHAAFLLLTGVGMYLHGLTEQGSGVIGAALLIFKGQK